MLNEISKILTIIAESIIHLWPYFVITIPIAVAVNVTGASKYINKALKNRPMTAIFTATVVGAFSPFCSCGVIPLIASLLIGGVPIAPVMSFWLASPSMDPEIFFLSVSTIGWNLAIWRLAATFVMSLSAGYITHFIVLKGWLGKDILKTNRTGAIDSTFVLLKKFMKNIKEKLSPEKILPAFVEVQPEVPQSSCGCSCGPSSNSELINIELPVKESFAFAEEKSKTRSFKKILFYETVSATLMVIKFMSLAFFLQALIVLYIPSEVIINLLGQDNPFAIITSALIGIPVYTSSTPALAMMGGLLKQGMSPAAVLSFLIAGPTTTLPAMAAVWNIANRKVFMLYVAFTFVGSVLAGYLYSFVNLF